MSAANNEIAVAVQRQAGTPLASAKAPYAKGAIAPAPSTAARFSPWTYPRLCDGVILMTKGPKV